MKVLVIGLGSIAKKHIKELSKLDPLVSIYALRSNKTSVKEEEGVINVMDLSDLELDSIDFVLISNPTSEHFSTIKKLVRYNKPLFIEKPLFSEVNEDTEQLVKEIIKYNLQTYIACNLRFLDAIVKLRGILQGVRINEVNVYCGSYLPDWRPDIDFRKVYSANKEMGGGVHIDLIHELDYVYWLFGVPSKTHSFFSNSSSLEISACDYANYLWIYEDFPVSIILNYYRKDSKRTLEVITDKGTYNVDLLKNSIMFNNECIFESSKRISDTYFDQMKYFTTKILGQEERFNTIEEANTILKLCMKV